MAEPNTNQSDNAKDSGAPFKRRSLGAEFYAYLMENKKWWMIPIILMVLLLAIALILGGSPAATLIYPLF